MDFLKVVPIDADYSGQLLHEYKQKKDLENHVENKNLSEKPINKQHIDDYLHER